MCEKLENGNTVDERGRMLRPDYERRPTRCEKCQTRRVQVHGRWCCECYQALVADSRIDWAALPNTLFEVYAKTANA